jgi:hypothetical protein
LLIAVHAVVVYATDTGSHETADNVNVNTRFVPSTTAVGLFAFIVGVGSLSFKVAVPTVGDPKVALVGELIVTVNVSAFSSKESSAVFTVIVQDVCP